MHKKIFRIILLSSVGLFVYMFYVNLFLDSWASSVGVWISLTIFDSNTWNNNWNTWNNNLNTWWINTWNNSWKGNWTDKPVKEDKPIVNSGSNNTWSNIHPAPSSGSVGITWNNVGTAFDSGSNHLIDKDLSSVSKGSLLKPSKTYINQDKQIETKGKSDLEEKIKTLPEKNSQGQNTICEEDKKNINATKISKVENFIKFFLYGNKTNVKTSILCTTWTKDVLSWKLISSSWTAKSKSWSIKNIVKIPVGNSYLVDNTKTIKKTWVVSKLSWFFVQKTKNVLSSVDVVVKKIPTHFVKSLLLGNRVVEHFIKSVFSYFR